MEISPFIMMVAGPNGSGKSTILQRIEESYKESEWSSKYPWEETYINADDITRDISLYFLSLALHSSEETNYLNSVTLETITNLLKEFRTRDSESFLSSMERIGISYSIREDPGGLLLRTTEGVYANYKYIKNFNQKDLRFTKKQKINIHRILNQEESLLPLLTGFNLIAAKIAEKERFAKIKNNQPLVFETVMSHPSKIYFIKQAKTKGFKFELIFVTTNNPKINIERIAKRVREGGHGVPETKVVSRYKRTLELLPKAISECNYFQIWDNSGKEPEAIMDVYPPREIPNIGVALASTVINTLGIKDQKMQTAETIKKLPTEEKKASISRS